MPYKKRSKGKMTRYRKKDNFTATADFARQGYYLAKRLKRLINVEEKIHKVDQSSPGITTAVTGIVHDLTVIPQGDTQFTRDGSSLKPLQFALKGFLASNVSSTQNTVRIILFRGKLENGVTPTVTSYLESANVLSFKNHDNRFQTQTLVDRTYHLTNSGTNKRVAVNIEQKLFGHVNYDDATTTIEGGGLYLLIIGDSNTTPPVFYYKSRMTYTDN